MFNQINGKFPRSGVIDPLKISTYDLCYHYYKHGQDFLFSKLRINNFNDETHFPKIYIFNIKSNPNEYVFKTNDTRKRRRCDENYTQGYDNSC